MRKSAWLLSAAMVAVPTTAFAQQPSTQPTQPDTTQTQRDADRRIDGRPTPPSTTRRSNSSRSTPATSSSPRRAVTRRCRTCRWRSARSPRDTLQNSGATDIRQLNQLSPSLLVSSTTSEGGAAVARIRGIGTVGDNPGLEGSVATYIDGVYRSRTGVALDRTRAARPDRGAARAARHVVRAQRVGRRDLGDHRQAAVHALRVGRSEHRQLRLSPVRGVAQRPARRNHRRAARRRLCEARRLHQGRDLRPPHQRSRPLPAARAGPVPAE